ncbi:AAA domain-containing protein [Gloeopeniophorella convolvens]|nr:AAA domain-containing protein [Gloeopeniophorella convolvens]
MDTTQTSTFQSVKAIYIVGPSSTGKTTLCNSLAARLGLDGGVFITEVARGVMREQGFSRKDVGRVEMQAAIMQAQLRQDTRARDAARSTGGRRIVLSDRSAVDAVVYAALNDADDGGTRSRTLLSSPEFQATLPAYRQSTFFLLLPIAEWMVDDGVRSLEDQWGCIRVFRTLLRDLGIAYYEVGEGCRWLEERVAVVRRAVQM